MEASDEIIDSRAMAEQVRKKFDMRDYSGQCAVHGEYIGHTFKGRESGCIKCFETRQKIEEVERQEAQRKEAEKAHFERKLGMAHIPERFADRTIDSYVPICKKSQNAKNVAMTYANEFEENKGQSLILCGLVGTGKTHLAIGIAHQVLALGKQPLFVSVSRAIRKIKESYSKTADFTEDEAIKLFIKPDLLILDEVGVQFGSETEKMYLFEIINGRYEKCLPTIIISNLGIAELENYIGTRVMDRLREGGGKAVVFDWESYRKSA